MLRRRKAGCRQNVTDVHWPTPTRSQSQLAVCCRDPRRRATCVQEDAATPAAFEHHPKRGMMMNTAVTKSASSRRSFSWTLDAIHELGVATDVETAGAILGIGRTKAYQLAKAGEFPVVIIRVGRRYVVPIGAILTLLRAPAENARGDDVGADAR